MPPHGESNMLVRTRSESNMFAKHQNGESERLDRTRAYSATIPPLSPRGCIANHSFHRESRQICYVARAVVTWWWRKQVGAPLWPQKSERREDTADTRGDRVEHSAWERRVRRCIYKTQEHKLWALLLVRCVIGYCERNEGHCAYVFTWSNMDRSITSRKCT